MSAHLDFDGFVAAAARFQRDLSRVLWELLILLTVYVGSLWGLAEAFEISKEPPEVMTPKRIWGLVVMAAGGFGVVVYLCVRLGRSSSHAGTACPHCSAPLLGGYNTSLAIATKHCPRCHKALFEPTAVEDDTTPSVSAKLDENPVSRLMTREQLRAANAASCRSFFKYIGVAVALAVVYGAVAATIVFLFRQRIEDAAGEVLAPFLKILLVFPSFVLLMWGIPVALRKSERAHRPRCPGCQEQLNHQALLLITGACSHCGQRVLSDALPLVPFATNSESSWVLMDRQQFSDESRKLQRRMPLCCLAGFAAGAGWFVVLAAMAYLLRATFGWPDKDNPVVIALMIPAPVLQIVIVWLVSSRLQRRLVCPHCRETLLHGQWLVIATGCCTHCGRQVLRSESPENSETEPT